MNIDVKVKDAILTLTLNRPRKMNSIDKDTSTELACLLKDVDSDPLIKVVVVTGVGDKVFSSGADLLDLAHGTELSTDFGGFTRRGISKPIIVAANGSAYGGGVEIMLSADIVIVEQGQEFSFPEVGLGIFPAAGGVLKLPRILPRSAAMDLLLSAEAISAERFYELGLASRLVEKGKAREEAMKIATLISSHSTEAVQAAKRIATKSTGSIPTEYWTINHAEADELLRSEDTKRRLKGFKTHRG